MRKCSCGNDQFYAHQICRHDVIVDSENTWQQDNLTEGNGTSAIYDSEEPYGPYECTKCGKTYNELEDLADLDVNKESEDEE